MGMFSGTTEPMKKIGEKQNNFICITAVPNANPEYYRRGSPGEKWRKNAKISIRKVAIKYYVLVLWKQNKKYNEAEKTAIRMVYNTIQDIQGFSKKNES